MYEARYRISGHCGVAWFLGIHASHIPPCHRDCLRPARASLNCHRAGVIPRARRRCDPSTPLWKPPSSCHDCATLLSRRRGSARSAGRGSGRRESADGAARGTAQMGLLEFSASGANLETTHAGSLIGRCVGSGGVNRTSIESEWLVSREPAPTRTDGGWPAVTRRAAQRLADFGFRRVWTLPHDQPQRVSGCCQQCDFSGPNVPRVIGVEAASERWQR